MSVSEEARSVPGGASTVGLGEGGVDPTQKEERAEERAHRPSSVPFVGTSTSPL